MMAASLLYLLLLLPVATRAAGFNCSLSSCGNSAACESSTGVCTCPTDKFLALEGDKCEQVNLLSPATPKKLTTTGSTFVASETVDLTADANFKGGIPLSNSELATQIFLCSNGYVTFNSNFCTTRVDLLKSDWTPPFVAPFATSFDFRKSIGGTSSTSEVSYKLVASVATDTALQKIRTGIPELANATSAIVFTWKMMSPPPLEQAEQISFQLILFTDFETVTAAVSLYSKTNTLKDYFDWLPTLIGSRARTNSAASLIAGTRSSSVAESLKPMTIGTGVTATARLTVLYTGSTPNYRKRCLDEAGLTLQPANSSTVLGWCPRSFNQAGWDPRFSQVASQPAFSLISSKLLNATQITCTYDTVTGGLLAMNSYSNITVTAGEVRVGAKLYEYCCDRMPNLCGNYYTKLPTPTSVNYQTPSAAGFAMGSGELRSFDGQLSRFLSVGDFWLVKTVSPSKLSVQVRMENTNPSANRTVGITGVVVQFTGTANLSTEFHWVQSTQQIMVNYVTHSGAGGSFCVSRNSTPDAVGQQITSNEIFTGTNTSLTCYVLGSSTWITARSGANGLSLSVYLDKTDYFNGSTSGLLGNYDDNKANDIAFSNGTTSTSSSVSATLETWKLAAGESLFQFPTTEPTVQAGWSALYWSADWNQTQIVQEVFAGDNSTYDAADQLCAASLSNTTAYQNCLMEFADCGTACATAYLELLNSTAQSLADFAGCSSPMLQWNASKTEISATEGTAYQVSLDTLIDSNSSGAVFAKVSGPSDLTVNQNGSLEWLLPSGVNVTPIVVSVSTTSGCASLVQLSVRLTRIASVSGVCANSVEDFGYLTIPAGESYRRDKIYLSTCKCNDNYYTANCSMATCPLDCHTCNSTVATECTACPKNYAAGEVTVAGTKVAVCSYVDKCSSSSCSGYAYKSCRSVDPALQTGSALYQCVCASGYTYPSSDSKTTCTDINECELKAYCDTSKNRVCTNTNGSYICDCSEGYALQSGQCADINECTKDTICQNGACVNTPGSYYCNCSSGYMASSSSSKACIDVNECSNPGLSGCTQNCSNSPGSFSCSCFDGFSPMPSCPPTKICTDPSVCSYSNLCSKIASTDTCQCPIPQELKADKKTCNGLNYCTSNPCGAGGVCAELKPGYNCTCNEYYELNAAKKCIPIDYCGRRDQYPAVCPTGSNVVCSVNVTTNEPTCGCRTGFARSATTNQCTDVNECTTGTSGCNSASTDCKNLIGSWLCKCKFGYKRINNTHCTPAPYTIKLQATFTDLVYQTGLSTPDSEEFLLIAQIIEKRLEVGLPSDGSGQPTFRVSSLTNGSVVAAGVVSYSTPQTPATVTSGASASGLTVVATPLIACQSNVTNECLPAVHDCVDTTNGYTCQCKSGYTQTRKKTYSGYGGTSTVIQVCNDVNECLTECRNDSNKECVNLPGSFTCSCIKGTFSTNATSLPCEDPCVAGRCKNSGKCQYQARDQFPYKCICMAGYTGFHCELRDEHYLGMQKNAIIIGVVLGVLLLICLVVVIVFFLRKYRINKNRADFYQSNFSDNPETHSGGRYKGTQSMAMSDTSIPRAQHSAHHPSTYENQGYERETHKTRTDYF